MASRDEVRSIDATTRDAMRDETRTTMRSVGGVNFKLFSRRRANEHGEDATETRRAGGISVICKENLADDDDDDG